jgi:hypothetical protein
VIAAAVVFFILLVSAQALRDWPISSLNFGGGGESASVSPAQSLGGSAANPAAGSLSGPVTATPANVAPAAKAGGGAKTKAPNHHRATGKVAPETQIQGSRGVNSAPVKQPSSTSPAPAPTSGSTPPAGTGTASPSPSGGSGGGSTPATGNSGGGNPSSGGNVGTRTARKVTSTVENIASTATPPAPSPVTNAVNEVAEKVSPTPPSSSSGTTSEKVGKAISEIGK